MKAERIELAKRLLVDRGLAKETKEAKERIRRGRPATVLRLTKETKDTKEVDHLRESEFADELIDQVFPNGALLRLSSPKVVTAGLQYSCCQRRLKAIACCRHTGDLHRVSVVLPASQLTGTHDVVNAGKIDAAPERGYDRTAEAHAVRDDIWAPAGVEVRGLSPAAMTGRLRVSSAPNSGGEGHCSG